MTKNADTGYTERRTWRDALDSLLALVSNGEDVDPAELAETTAKAEAEATVEDGRASWTERKKAEQARKDAAKLANKLAADIDPDTHVKGLAEAKEAWDAYQAVIIAVADRFGEHERKVNALLQAVADSGAPHLKAQSNTELPDAAVLSKPMSRPVPVWGGVTYSFARLSGTFLPHRGRHRLPRFDAIDRQG